MLDLTLSFMAWGIPIIAISVIAVVIPVLFRRVVSTNMVHIVQRRRKTTPYGTGQTDGNVYYQWPAWVPYFGITVIALPVSNFDLSLKDYEAYDKDRVPFMVDVVAFFRIKDTACAAQRVASLEELMEQLSQIVQGAVRKVLASDVIDNIMLERAQFGTAFTGEVAVQLEEWGTESVKSMELMDIRDGIGSHAISNIMAKKTSHIEMQSRTEVANNMKLAKTAEIEAQQAVDIRSQEAEQMVGQRTAEKTKEVGISGQKAQQAVFDAEKDTRESQMSVKRVQEVRQAEITKDQQIVVAEQDKKTRIIKAEGLLEAQKNEAEGTRVVGEAKGVAEQAMLMAPVNAQINLAREIGGNAGYQQYLVTIEAIRAHIVVGSKQAEALQEAEVKVIANAGKPTEGMSSVMEMFSSKGGTELGGMVEGFAQTPLGTAILAKIGVGKKANGVAPSMGTDVPATDSRPTQIE